MAARLGIHRSTLYAKLRRYDLLGEADSLAAERRDERHDVSDTATLAPTVSK